MRAILAAKRAPALARLVLCLCALSSPAAAQSVWFVDDSASPGGAGTSWAQAFDTLDAGLAAASAGDSVWVAAGRYFPSSMSNPPDARSATFLVPQAVSVYGGFDGTELTLAARAGLFSSTVLSGDLGVADDWSDNAYHVVTLNNPSGPPPGSTKVDGFKITRGNADGSGGGSQGGGVFAFNSATEIFNCIMTENYAVDGAAVHAQPGSLAMRRCHILGNHADDRGGGLFGATLFSVAANCIFEANTAGSRGGAVYLNSSNSVNSGTFVNSLFFENEANRGGAVFLGGGAFASGKATFRHCTFSLNNATTDGGAILARTSGVTVPAESRVFNAVVWDNSAPTDPELGGSQTVSYSNVAGGAPLGTGNISSDPLFQNAASGDFTLGSGSPCIDAADNDLTPDDDLDLDEDGIFAETLPLDLAEQRRVVDDPSTTDTGNGTAPIVDMGAYEFQP